MPTYVFDIVPAGGDRTQSLFNGIILAPDVDSARDAAQTDRQKGVVWKPGLEVVVFDSAGETELWRGPYLGTR
jgi:hypothetical protein